jgi:glycerol-3-phosphate O-acyltransferase/dihydroxyacetone phosphate acyltransferase
MLYRILRALVRLALKVYFRKITVKGLEYVPKEGPIVMVSNHPSGYFDPLCICAALNPKISFLGKSTIFSNKLLSLIFENINIVPVYRVKDDPNNKGKNDGMFLACYNKLANKGLILIFPEGTSKSDRRLGSIKTGAARIALGAARVNSYNLKPKLLPVGLNYSNSSKFRSHLRIEFGSPLASEDYFDTFKNNEIKAVQDLTADIEDSMRSLIINIDKSEYEELVLKVEKMVNVKKLENNVSGTQSIYDAIIYYQKNNIELYEQTKNKIDDYFINLDEMGISDRSLQSISDIDNIWKYTLKTIVYAFLGFPIWLFGVIHGYPPYKIAKSITPKVTDRREFYGAIGIMIGMLSFLLLYSMYLLISWLIFHSIVITLAYLVVLPITAVFCLYYARTVRKLYHNLKTSSKMFSAQQVLASLILDRNDIVSDLEKIGTDFQSLDRDKFTLEKP